MKKLIGFLHYETLTGQSVFHSKSDCLLVELRAGRSLKELRH